VQSQKRNVGHLHHLETNTGDVTHGVSLTTESRHQNLIVFLEPREKPHTSVTQSLVNPYIHHSRDQHGLLHFLKHDAFGVRRSTEGVGLQSSAQMGLLVLFIMPLLLAAVVPQFSSSTQSTTLAWRMKKKKCFFFPKLCKYPESYTFGPV
uniref:Uncharacterized protein n=1 Tax=Cyprinus carpio TaxID=7962 RepID=A0A8C1WV60_CYPCA